MDEKVRQMSIYERIDAAYEEISQAKVTKDGSVTGGAKYNYVTIAQILDIVRRAHGKFGVKVFFGLPQYNAEQFEKRYTEIRKGNYGETKWQIANGHIEVRIVGRDEEDVIEMQVPFEAQDNSDKLTNKIITNAERTLYRTLYAIDEGEGSDPEAQNIVAIQEEKPQPPPKEDRFFGSPKRLEDAQPATAREKQEAAYLNKSQISDETVKIAIAYAKRYIYSHSADKYVMGQIKRFGSADPGKWPKAHVIDMANLQREAEGKEPFEYSEGSA